MSTRASIAVDRDNLSRVIEGCAHDEVFDNMELLRLIFTFIPRWERAGVLSGVCHGWRSVIWSHADLYRKIVLLCSTSVVCRSQMRTEQYGAAKFVNEGALTNGAREA
jgi:hypothetical protein